MGSVGISPNSVARFTAAARVSIERSGQDVWLGLQNGYVSVHEGDKPVSVRAHGGKITASSGAVFDVAQVNGKTVVTAVKGTAVMSEGGLAEPRTVKQGENVQVAFLESGAGAFAQGSKPQPAAATCNDPCKKDSASKECKDFKALEKQCTPLRKACAADSKQCSTYGSTCKALDGCKGYEGVAAAAGGTAAASSASSAAAASAAAGAAGAATSATAVAVTAAAVAGTAAAVAVPVAAASQGSQNNAVVSSIK